MSEEQDSQVKGDESTFEPITSQEDFERRLAKRLERERSKFADYDEVKSKAAKLEELEQASKTELQLALERAEAAEKQIGAATLSALHARIAADTGVPVEMIHGEDEETARASAQKVLDWSEQRAPKRKAPAASLKSGASGSNDRLTDKERAAAALRQIRGA